MNSSQRHAGVLIVGHGTRNEAGRTGFLQIVDMVGRMIPEMPVVPCFLELASPSIHEGLDGLVQRGVRRVTAMPLLLLAAGHVREDIPLALANASSQYDDVEVRQVAHPGLHAGILELSSRRFQESVADLSSVPPHETLLLLASRGSRDPRATREMRRVAAHRRMSTPVAAVETCFLAMEKPSLREALEAVSGRSVRRVVVQPHLLLPGALVDRVGRAVDRYRGLHPAKEWVVSRPLGADRAVAEAVVDICLRDLPANEPRTRQYRKTG